MTGWDGEEYQRRIESRATQGTDMHGEARFVETFAPATVLDAGCGTGRVAIELARRGIAVAGVDSDPSMLATARRLAPHLTWLEADLTELHLGRTFEVVLMAGNVPLFTPVGTTASLLAGCARHLPTGGHLVAGFSVPGSGDVPASAQTAPNWGYTTERYDDEARRVGLTLVERYATWDRDPYTEEAAYAVSVHRMDSPT